MQGLRVVLAGAGLALVHTTGHKMAGQTVSKLPTKTSKFGGKPPVSGAALAPTGRGRQGWDVGSTQGVRVDQSLWRREGTGII